MAISIVIACDHAGYKLKEAICEHYKKLVITDLGAFSEKPVDYPDYATKVAEYLKTNSGAFGILICGSGIGISIAANRYSHIRAALCREVEDAKISRLHNDANVLVLGGRITEANKAFNIIDEFISTPFEGGRHEKRKNKLEI